MIGGGEEGSMIVSENRATRPDSVTCASQLYIVILVIWSIVWVVPKDGFVSKQDQLTIGVF